MSKPIIYWIMFFDVILCGLWAVPTIILGEQETLSLSIRALLFASLARLILFAGAMTIGRKFKNVLLVRGVAALTLVLSFAAEILYVYLNHGPSIQLLPLFVMMLGFVIARKQDAIAAKSELLTTKGDRS